MKISYWHLLASIVACELVGFAGSYSVSSSMTWYSDLVKPSFAPPNWVFGPVWVTLYALMGLALYLFYSSRGGFEKKKYGYTLFAAQLFFNGVWSYLFFGLQSPLYGMINLLILWLLIVAVMLEFSVYSRKAVAALVPYFAWVSVAAVLNYFILVLN